jgi:hypothetical protein
MPKIAAQAERRDARPDHGDNTIDAPEIRWEAERFVHGNWFWGSWLSVITGVLQSPFLSPTDERFGDQ